MNPENGSNETVVISSQAFAHAEKIAQELVHATAKSGGSMPDNLYVLSSFAAGVMNVIAMCLADQRRANGGKLEYDDFDPTKGITPETLLYSALLVNKVTPDYDHRSHFCESTMSPVQFWEAMDAYEKLTGKQIDDFIAPGMAKAARVASTMGKEVLSAFMERRKASPDGSASLN